MVLTVLVAACWSRQAFKATSNMDQLVPNSCNEAPSTSENLPGLSEDVCSMNTAQKLCKIAEEHLRIHRSKVSFAPVISSVLCQDEMQRRSRALWFEHTSTAHKSDCNLYWFTSTMQIRICVSSRLWCSCTCNFSYLLTILIMISAANK